MATAYPSNYDNFTNPVGTDLQNAVAVPHATQHANLNDTVEAIEAELGLNPSGSYATVLDRLVAIEQSITTLGATAFGAIADGTITGVKLVDASITTAKLASNSVTSDKLATDSVTTGKIVNLAVTTTKLADDAVNYSKIAHSEKLRLRRIANQSVTAASGAYISFDAEYVDTSGYFPGTGTTITIPTTHGGVYLIFAYVTGFLNPSLDFLQIEVTNDTTATPTSQVYPESVAHTSATSMTLADLGDGATVKLWAFNGHASTTANFQAKLYMIKLFDA